MDAVSKNSLMSGKQCRPRWDAAFCSISSGSTLFAQPVCSNTYGKYGSKIELLKVEDKYGKELWYIIA